MTNAYSSANQAFYSTLIQINNFSAKAKARGLETKEILNWSFSISNPRNRKITIPGRKWSEALAVGELCWHLSASSDVGFISYYAKNWASFSLNGSEVEGSCYGKHIFQLDPIRKSSQWETIKELLKRDPHTRRAVLAMNYPTLDVLRNSDLPCITNIQFFIRNNHLHCINNMRSNDVIWGLCYDVYFVTMLQEILAYELGVEIGIYHHNAASMHLYSRFFNLAIDLLEVDFNNDDGQMPPIQDMDKLSEFLLLENLLRTGNPEAVAAHAQLPSYWKSLSKPLIKKAIKNFKNSFSEDMFSGFLR